MIREIVLLIVLVAFTRGTTYEESLEAIKSKETLILSVIEDHPWVIKFEKCPPANTSCYRGVLIDIIDLIRRDVKFNYTINEATEFGKLDKSKNPAEWTGLIGLLTKNETDIGLAAFNVTNFGDAGVTLSAPFVDESFKRNVTYALAFPKGSKLEPAFSQKIKKLIKQRYIEQLLELWFNDLKKVWSKDKQISKL